MAPAKGTGLGWICSGTRGGRAPPAPAVACTAQTQPSPSPPAAQQPSNAQRYLHAAAAVFGELQLQPLFAGVQTVDHLLVRELPGTDC